MTADADNLYFSSRSIKHDQFWLHLREKGEMTVFEFLEKAFEPDNYFGAVQRALAIPTCRIVPYCDVFVQIIKAGIAADYRYFSDTIHESSSPSSNGSPYCARDVWRDEVRKSLPSDVHFNTKLLEPQRRERNNFRTTNIDAQIAIERFLAIVQHQITLSKIVPQNMLDYLR